MSRSMIGSADPPGGGSKQIADYDCSLASTVALGVARRIFILRDVFDYDRGPRATPVLPVTPESRISHENRLMLSLRAILKMVESGSR